MIAFKIQYDASGDAVLTVSGSREVVTEIASRVLPGRPDTPPSSASPSLCVACGGELTYRRISEGTDRCAACESEGWTPLERPTLTTEQLNAMAATLRVFAGGFRDSQRSRRESWVKLHNGRWTSPLGERVGGKPGVSAEWLATNRRPRLDE